MVKPVMDVNNSSLFTELTVGEARVNDGFGNLGGFDISERLNPSTDTLTALLQASSVFDQPLVSIPSLDELPLSSNAVTSETGTDTQSDTLELQDATVDNGLLFDFNQPSLGNLETNTTESLGGLFDDPIEYGDPFTEASYWRRQEGNSCAVVAQICVYQSLTGQYISEAAACDYAQQQGWYDPATGTLPEHVGDILNVLGVDTYQVDGSLNGLASALAMGDKPIVGLDAFEIWNPQYDSSGNPLEQTDGGHAVWVTGIDTEADGSCSIILNDSGIDSGMAEVVDSLDFMNAWHDSGYFVTVADNPLI